MHNCVQCEVSIRENYQNDCHLKNIGHSDLIFEVHMLGTLVHAYTKYKVSVFKPMLLLGRVCTDDNDANTCLLLGLVSKRTCQPGGTNLPHFHVMCPEANSMLFVPKWWMLPVSGHFEQEIVYFLLELGILSGQNVSYPVVNTSAI